jgi:GNAT superfamily N-acetyltransferase
MEENLVELCQQHLIHAWCERVRHAERAIGDQFGFEIAQRGGTTLLLAHRWPQAAAGVPFHRVFNYHAPPDTVRDPMLDRLADEHIDAVIEVLPGAHQPHTERMLHTYYYQPVWSIPWLYIPTEQFSFGIPAASVERIGPVDLGVFAALLITGYGYTGLEAEAWRTFAQFGYAAPQFSCFLASHDQRPAALGVLHLHQDSALVDGAATLPQHRGLGLQKVLLATRILYARECGARHAFSRTGSGSISQANMHKVGMRLLVESAAWRRTDHG